jgi:hypothetical protein
MEPIELEIIEYPFTPKEQKLNIKWKKKTSLWIDGINVTSFFGKIRYYLRRK